MFGKKPSVDPQGQEKEQISKFLRQADELVRVKNFDGALNATRKALAIDPKHTLARSFQQRILLIQKQSEPVEEAASKGPSPEEVNQRISLLFSAAEQLIGKREYQEALTRIAEVYQLEPGSHYARAYSDRIEQLIMEDDQRGISKFGKPIIPNQMVVQNASSPQSERGSLMMYEEMLKEYWFDGKISPEEENELKAVRDIFAITTEEHKTIENKVKLESYIEALRLAWKDGVISEMERQVLDMMRKRYSITADEHLKLEDSVREAKRGTKPKARILVVTADKELLANITRTLQQRHYEVVHASRAEDALHSMAKQIPELIISEVIFSAGAMDGFEFFESVQKHSSLENVPFFFLAETKNQNIIRAALRMGFDLYLTKPVDVDLLVAGVDGRLLAK
ncbi:MAG: response regulator [Bacteroidota bacterium]|nr:response regulator [Bacteroidota bacterium]